MLSTPCFGNHFQVQATTRQYVFLCADGAFGILHEEYSVQQQKRMPPPLPYISRYSSYYRLKQVYWNLKKVNYFPLNVTFSPQRGITILLGFSHIKYASRDGRFHRGQVASSPRIWGRAHQLSSDSHIRRVYDTFEK